MAKHTLYITFDGLSDPLGQSQILPYLKGISGKGYKVTILSCEKKKKSSEEIEKIQLDLNDHDISWDYIIYNENGNFLTRLGYIRRLYRKSILRNKDKKFCLVHCRSYLAALIGLRLKRKFAIPFLFDMRGFWADERIDGNIWNLSNPLHRLFYLYFKKKERDFLNFSDAIISLTHAAEKKILDDFKVEIPADKITIIPCCVNTRLFDPDHVKQNHDLIKVDSGDHLLVYTGSIGTWYYTREMIDCVSAWKTLIPSLKLLIVTRDVAELESLLSKYPDSAKNAVLFTTASYQQVPYLLTLAKASIFFIKPSYSKIASSPTKMAECWAMNLPIITNPGIGDNDRYFSDEAGGVLVKEFNTGSYIDAAKKYLHLQASGKNFRSIALKDFDLEKGIEKYAAIYEKLCSEN